MIMREALKRHWPEYLMEAAELGLFMIAAGLVAVLLEYPGSPIRQAVPDAFLRRVVIGLAMGLTAISIVYSPIGKRSGAHFNPSVTLTFFRLGKVAPSDALFYVLSQFIGGIAGVVTVAAFLGNRIADPSVSYVVTQPGPYGTGVAFLAEVVISFILMSVILAVSDRDHLARYTGLFAGSLVATFISLEAPLSGMSMNPARTLGSAVGAQLWTALWIYFLAPPLGMLTAAQLHLWRKGAHTVRCAKLHHQNDSRCIFCAYQATRKTDVKEREKAMMMKSLGLALALAATTTAAQAQTAAKKTLTLDGAKRIVEAAAGEAAKDHAGGAIAVVDDGGLLILLERLDNTFPAAASVATDKARTAAQFRMPTRNFENAVKNGRVAVVGVPQINPLQGGVPIVIDGQVVGAVGVSGAMNAPQDDEIATVAANALNSTASTSTGGGPIAAAGPVTYIDSQKVAAAFAKGMPLIEEDGYKVHASRREKPGMAEIHTKDTDIIYVLGGEANFVTGGTAIDPKTTAPDEVRGRSIQGGETRRIVKGDVLIVPNGTPHWFRDVNGPLTYYVVKVTAADGGAR
jgi:aquaporin Z